MCILEKLPHTHEEAKADPLGIVCVRGKREATQHPAKGEQVPELLCGLSGSRTAVPMRDLWLRASSWVNLRHNIGWESEMPKKGSLGAVDTNS